LDKLAVFGRALNPLQDVYLTVAWLELAKGSKICSTDRQKLAHSSLKQFGGLTVLQIKNL